MLKTNKRNFFVLLLAGLFCMQVFLAPKALAQQNSNQTGGNAIGLYSDCYYGDDFGDSKKDRISVRPIGNICYQRCETECSGLIQKDIDPILNADSLNQCRLDCRRGDATKDYALKYKDSSGTMKTKTVKINSACNSGVGAIDSASYNFYKSSFAVSQGDQIVVKLKPVPNNGYGSVSLCGTDTAVISPIFESSSPSAWSSSNAWQNMNTSPFTWSAKNRNITDTGIDIKNGDILNIMLTFNNGYYYCSNALIGCTSRNLLIRKPFSGPLWDTGNNNVSSLYQMLPGTKIVPVQVDSNGNYINGDTGAQIPPANLSDILKQNAQVTWNGLYGKGDFVPITDQNGKITGSQVAIRFSGILNGFSDRFTRLGITHDDAGTRGYAGKANAWADNMGGATVTIQRQGCIYENGDRLEYAILQPDATSTPKFPKYQDPNTATWTSLTQVNLMQFKPVVMNQTGQLVFRINVPPYDASSVGPICGNSDPICQNSLAKVPQKYTYANTNGYYNIEVEQARTDPIGSNAITNIAKNIRTYLFGKDPTTGDGGIVQQIFNEMVTDTSLVTMIRAAILFFMTWTGFSYVAGMAQITQRDALIRLLSLGMVLILIAPGSWKFFNTYLFGLFIQGEAELISQVIDYGQFGIDEVTQRPRVAKEPELIFAIYDKVFTIFAGRAFWYKMAALVFSSWLGIYVFVALFIATAFMATAMIKAFIVFMISMVILAVLLILAPVFITFLLFKYTRKMFMSWIGQLISVVLQPVVILASLGIFINLFLAGIYAALGFTVCRICWFGLAFPPILPFTCIIPAFATINSMHSPDDAVLISPMTNLAAGLYVLVIGHAAYVFIQWATTLVNTIVSQNYFTGIDLSSYANIGDYTSRAIGVGMKPFGFALGTADAVRGARHSITSVTDKLVQSGGLGFDIANDKKSFPKVTSALVAASTQSGAGGLSDKDFALTMQKMGYRAKELERSNLSADDIRQALLASSQAGQPAARGSMVYNKMVDPKSASPELEKLLDRAEGGNLQRDYGRVARLLTNAHASVDPNAGNISDSKLIQEFHAIGNEPNKSLINNADILRLENTNLSDAQIQTAFEDMMRNQGRGQQARLNALADAARRAGP